MGQRNPNRQLDRNSASEEPELGPIAGAAAARVGFPAMDDLQRPDTPAALQRLRALRRAALFGISVGLLGAPLGCASSPYDVGFRGPGRLLLIFESATQERALVVSDRKGIQRLSVERPRDARWVTPGTILVLSEEIPEEFRLPRTHLLHIQMGADRERVRIIDGPRRHYDPEPSPDGRWLALGVDIAEVGESDLEIWELGEAFERIASRAQALDEPRWSPDARALVASHPIPDPLEGEDSLGGGFGGVSFPWPRLFRLRRDLGHPTLLHDGATPASFARGGTLPLWWAAEGIYARQAIGLVLCAPERGTCTRVYAPGADRRVVDGRGILPSKSAEDSSLHEALLLVARAETPRLFPSEIHRVDLDSGEGEILFRAPEGVLILDIDWIAMD